MGIQGAHAPPRPACSFAVKKKNSNPLVSPWITSPLSWSSALFNVAFTVCPLSPSLWWKKFYDSFHLYRGLDCDKINRWKLKQKKTGNGNVFTSRYTISHLDLFPPGGAAEWWSGFTSVIQYKWTKTTEWEFTLLFDVDLEDTFLAIRLENRILVEASSMSCCLLMSTWLEMLFTSACQQHTSA